MKTLNITILTMAAILMIALPVMAGSYSTNSAEISNERGDGSPFATSQTENQSDDVRGYFGSSSGMKDAAMGPSSKDLSRENGGYQNGGSIIRSNAEELTSKDSSRDNGSPRS